MHGLGDAAQVRSAAATVRGAATVVLVSMLTLLAVAGPSWGSETAGTDSAAVPGPELLGVPLLTFVWALSGVLAVVVGLMIASRSTAHRASGGTLEQPIDRAGSVADRDRS